MVRKLSILLLYTLLPVFIFGGCSDETTAPDEFTQATVTTLIAGDIDPNGGSFEYTVDSAGEGDNIPGPFVIRGTNVHYADSLGVLSVDFSVANNGRNTYSEPVSLTFIKLLPDSVTVENPDNDEHGAGAGIVFKFDDDDNMWAPGEESVLRTVEFGVGRNVSIGFVARIDVGMDNIGGSIGGVVWHDVNEDGVLDPGEAGVGGVGIRLATDDLRDPGTSPPMVWRTETAPDGTYRFDYLDAGYYRVIKVENDKFRPTTAAVIEVILVENNGNVSDFLLANFGCVPVVDPEKRIEVGDWVAVNGEYDPDPPHIIARNVDVFDCSIILPPGDSLPRLAVGCNGDHDWDGDHDMDGDHDWDRDHDWDHDHDWDGCDECQDRVCRGLKNELRGPVTDVNRDDRAIEIMGVWVNVVYCDSLPNDTIPADTTYSDGHHYDNGDGDGPGWNWLNPDSVEVGDRVRVCVFQQQAEGKLYGFFLTEWDGSDEQVSGRVEWVSDASEPVEAIRVLGLDISITAETGIRYKN